MTWLRIAWILLAIVFAGAILDPLSTLDYRRPALWSGEYIATGLAFSLFVGAVTVWLVPRATLAAAAAAAVIATVLAPSLSVWWVVAGLSAAALLGFILVRDSRSRPGGDVVVPATGVPFRHSWAASSMLHRWLGVGGLAAVAVAGTVGLVLHHMEVTGAADFEAGASLHTVPVSSIDDEERYQFLTVLVDGVEFEIESPWYEDVAVGEPVVVLSDGARAVLAGAGQDNPSWILGLVAGLPMVAAAVWGTYVAPGRRRARLVAHGAASVTVRVVCNAEIALALPTDADWPVIELTRIQGLVDRQVVAAHVDAEDGQDWDWPSGEGDGGGDAVTMPATPTEVAAWADDVYTEFQSESAEALTPEEKSVIEAVVGPDTNGAEPFILVGGWAHGSTVALARATGQVWLAEVEEPQPFKGRRRFLRSASPGQPGWELDDGVPTTVQENLSMWALRQGRWTRWAAALAVAGVGAVAVPFMLVEVWGDWFDNIRLILAVCVVATGPFWATSWSWGEFSRFRQGFGWYGLLLDDVVGPGRVEVMTPGRNAVGVRLRSPEDMLSIDPAVVRPGASPEVATAELQSWLDTAPRGLTGGRRPTPALVATMLMVLAWAAQLLPLAA